MSQKSDITKRHIKRAFEILTHQGPRAFINKVKLRLSERKAVAPAPTAEETIAFSDLDKAEVPFTGTLAVHLHLYYDDLAEEFATALKNIPVPFDLYISVRKELTDGRIAELKEIFEQTVKTSNAVKPRNAAGAGTNTAVSPVSAKAPATGRVTIRRTENRGRDIAPMYALFGKELSSYTIVLHMHSKKSLYTGSEQMDWRQYSVKALIGTPERVSEILTLFESRPDIGLVYPKRFAGMAPEAYGWLSNAKKGREFLESIGVPFHEGIFLYPAGSFFFVRNAAIRQVWDRKLTYEDFDEEAGQTDGTLAHVLERAIGRISSANGFEDAVVDTDDGKFHLGADRDTFAPVFRRDYTFLETELMSYDVISFDLFDTLLTRKYSSPDALFAMVPAAATEAVNIRKAARESATAPSENTLSSDTSAIQKYTPGDFRDLRIRAEIEAIEKKGASCTLTDIYACLQEMEKLSDEDRDRLMQAELTLEEDTLIPRRDMCTLYRKLISAGKTVLIVSDMYLPRSFYEIMLNKNSLTGYEKLYLSCEEGLRKDDGSLWEKVLSDWKGKTFAHVGDNQCADWQQLSDRKEKTLWIMSPAAEEKIAGIPELMSLDQTAAAKTMEAGKDSRSHDEAAISTSPFLPLLRGLSRNGGLFNSPFALAKDGQARFTDPYTMGYTVFGPLLYEYMVWLQESTPADACLAFLAREGWLFEQVYEIVTGDRAKEHGYLLTSRRAVSVAAIRTEDEIKGILRRKYDGGLHNLLEARLGAGPDILKQISDHQVHIADETAGEADDYEKVLSEIKPLLPALLKNAGAERKAYLSYLENALPEGVRDRAVLVDIGYAGTIQYYMAKLLQKPVAAAYLAVFSPHPGLAETGCRVLSMYRKEENSFADVIEKTQLFLESVLQAPYGQLLHFTDEGTPVYREEEGPSEGIKALQAGLLAYCRDRAAAEMLVGTRLSTDGKSAAKETVPSQHTSAGAARSAASRAYMEALYKELLVDHDYLSEKTAALFSVEDRYSQDTKLHLNPVTHRWEI